jgi:hypothetical protein
LQSRSSSLCWKGGKDMKWVMAGRVAVRSNFQDDRRLLPMSPTWKYSIHIKFILCNQSYLSYIS